MSAKSTLPIAQLDRDDAPRITADWAAKAELRCGDAILREASPPVRIGRPPKPDAERKRQVTLRIDPVLLHSMRASGKGWQSRVEAILRSEYLGKKSRAEDAIRLGEKLASSVANAAPKTLSGGKSTGQMQGAKRTSKNRKSA